MFLEIYIDLYYRLFLIKLPSVSNFIKKDPRAGEFPCEYCEIFMEIYFKEHLQMSKKKDNSSFTHRHFETTASKTNTCSNKFLDDVRLWY